MGEEQLLQKRFQSQWRWAASWKNQPTIFYKSAKSVANKIDDVIRPWMSLRPCEASRTVSSITNFSNSDKFLVRLLAATSREKAKASDQAFLMNLSMQLVLSVHVFVLFVSLWESFFMAATNTYVSSDIVTRLGLSQHSRTQRLLYLPLWYSVGRPFCCCCCCCQWEGFSWAVNIPRSPPLARRARLALLFRTAKRSLNTLLQRLCLQFLTLIGWTLQINVFVSLGERNQDFYGNVKCILTPNCFWWQFHMARKEDMLFQCHSVNFCRWRQTRD